MEHWLALFHDDNSHLRELATAAEALGFAGIAVPDHVAIHQNGRSQHPSGRPLIQPSTPCWDPLLTLAAVAAVTTSLRLMTGVYVLPMRDPFTVAKQVVTLAIQSDYRLVFGVGAGWNFDEMALLGHDPTTRGRRMDEMLALMQQLWTQGLVTFHGDFFTAEGVGQFPVPQHPIPILIGGSSAAALQRATRYQGWLGMDGPLDQLQHQVRQVNAAHQAQLAVEPGGIRPFKKYVIYNASRLAQEWEAVMALGLDGLVCMPWPFGDSAISVAAKVAAIQRYADQFIRC